MIKVIKLDAEDVREIVAKHFDVPLANVMIDIYNEPVGYGMGEHMEPRLAVEVETR